MSQTSRPGILVMSSLVCLALSACNSQPQTPSALSVNEAASTLVALTFEAATHAVQSKQPTLLPLLAATPTFQNPRLYVNSDAKCRTGTGSNSKVVASFTAGTTLDMVGRSSAEGGWLVKVPDGSATCWIRVLESSPSGSFQDLPEVTPEPSTHRLPSAPVEMSWPFFCSYVDGLLYKITINLSWIDEANDANGFRIYRQDQVIADVPSDTKAFSDTTNVTLGSQLTYSVEAYNDAGVSPRLVKTIDSVCKGKP
jgi:hypothetical protein